MTIFSRITPSLAAAALAAGSLALIGAPARSQSLADDLRAPAPTPIHSAATHAARHRVKLDDAPARDAAIAAPERPSIRIRAVDNAPKVTKQVKIAKTIKIGKKKPAVQTSPQPQSAIYSAPAAIAPIAASAGTPNTTQMSPSAVSPAPMPAPVAAPLPTPSITAQPTALPIRHPAHKPISIDSLTRDGGAASQSPLATGGMNIGGAVLRTILALVFVLGLVCAVIYLLRKKGYGMEAGENGKAFPAQSLTFAPRAPAGAVRRTGTWRPANTLPSFNPPAASRINALSDFEVIGHQLLPGTNSSLYKVKTADRILLLGCSPDGTLSMLTEWDVETRPESEDEFERLLSEMQESGANYPFANGERLSVAAGRLGQTAKRLDSLGDTDTRRAS